MGGCAVWQHGMGEIGISGFNIAEKIMGGFKMGGCAVWQRGLG